MVLCPLEDGLLDLKERLQQGVDTEEAKPGI